MSNDPYVGEAAITPLAPADYTLAGWLKAQNLPTTFSVTLTVDTAALVDGDVMSDTVAIPNVFSHAGGTRILNSISVVDESDQGVAFDIILLDSNVSIGAVNGPISLAAADAYKIVDIESITSGWIDLINSKFVVLSGIGVPVKAATGSTTLYIATVARAAADYVAATNIKIKLGFV